jgi:16S rRNA (guanine527-N7)-methyltransferase
VSDDVSRETVGSSRPPGAVSRPPSVPPEARRVFASGQLPLAERYADLLATEGVLRGLIGPREAPRLWERHLLNSAVLAEAIPESASVCDIGTGAGLPGLVVAIARPDVRITLVEPLLRRTTFLEEVIADLGLDHVSVVRGRADDLHGQATFDVVTSRAVAPLERLLGWSMPLVAPEGALVAMKGRSAHEEIESAQSSLATWRCGEPEVLELGAGVVSPPTTVVRVSWADPSRIGWPLAREAKRRRPRHDRRAARER